MQKKYLGVLLGCALLLTGCGHQVAKLQKYEPGVETAQKAFLVVKIDNFDYLDIKRVDDADGDSPVELAATANDPKEVRKLFLEQNDINIGSPHLDITNEFRILKTTYLFKPFSYANALYTITPGTYYISFVAIDSETGVYYSEAPGLNKEGVIAYGAFEVKPGEVVYLGDIECQWRSTNRVKKFYIHDKLTAVKKDLKEAGMTGLANKIVQAKFYPSGSNISSIK